MYLSDGISRIDYVLVWTYKNTDKRRVEKENTRRIFEENLKQEGLILEWDIKVSFVFVYRRRRRRGSDGGVR